MDPRSLGARLAAQCAAGAAADYHFCITIISQSGFLSLGRSALLLPAAAAAFNHSAGIHKERNIMSKAQIKFYAHYVRYALPALASVVFRLSAN
jgi:hypothetical protein